MQLTLFTDASLRILIHLARQAPATVTTTAELAQMYNVPFNHLNKAVTLLSREGWVRAVRGRGGGLKLGIPAAEIIVGTVVRTTEPGIPLVDCPSCPLRFNCELQRALSEALQAFYGVLDRYTLADLAQNTMLLGAPPSAEAWAPVTPAPPCAPEGIQTVQPS
ncbi:Rrf2 family transcriptional regulator [Deinococcus sp. QL22]|uniref:Rrf2 family transcriptional regulator n=1 Tax=Deinococcus sp. QL22 TaxID=2939437 RepID=UPI0020178C43|nr:Rrf2 family transcriptional regulator [Deinococcus sp. QL22]UQN08154.1 Rrf2 family transcriptional regulator [Deinococcus sp. QL22]